MARRELGPASLAVGQAVAAMLPPGPVVIGCSGGADSLALALGARWAAARSDATVRCVVVDHGLQEGSDRVAAHVEGLLQGEGMTARVRRVDVALEAPGGLEAAARDARLAALSEDGHPVMLGHTLDDQAESVLLGLLRGSGTRSLAGMAPVREPFIRPLLALRRATTEAACVQWGVAAWGDPHNSDERFRRVRARHHVAALSGALGQDVAPALARSATLARMDADLLEQLAREAAPGLEGDGDMDVDEVRALPAALRLRVLRDWIVGHDARHVSMAHVLAVDALVMAWSGQGAVAVPGGEVVRRGATLQHHLT